MKDNFLESDSFCTKRILIFGINRVQSHATMAHVKQIDAMYDQFIVAGIDEIHCISFCDFLLFDQLMPHVSKKIKFAQLDEANMKAFQLLLNKKGHPRYLQDFWQFATVVNRRQVEYYVDQPFPKTKVSPDTWMDIYSEESPEKVLAWLTDKSV